MSPGVGGLQLKEARDEPHRCPGREGRAIILIVLSFILSYPAFKLTYAKQRDRSLPKLGSGLTGVHFIRRFHGALGHTLFHNKK